VTGDAPFEKASPKAREISGTKVVISLLMLGLLATSVIYIYWDLHTRPFRPLTEAIGRTFKYSLPKVEGGRHRKNPAILRIALRVPFPPGVDEKQTEETLRTLFGLIRQHQDLTGFEKVQIHLIQIIPEETAKKKTFEFTPEQVLSDSAAM